MNPVGRTSSTQVVVVGMGIDAPTYDAALVDLAAVVGATTAYLQAGTPALLAELDRLAQEGVAEVVLVGAARGAGVVPGVSWLRRIAAHWWRQQAEERPAVVVAQRVHRFDGLDDLARHRREIGRLVGGARPVTGDEAGLTSAAWEDVPGHRHHVLVCRGPRCSAQRSDLTARAIGAELDRQGRGDDDVLVAQTGCLYPCNHGPVVVVHPDDVWYGAVDAEVAVQIVTEHLVGGRVATERRLSRDRRGSRQDPAP